MMCGEFDIIGLLHGLGMSSKLKGFRYLFDMICDIIFNNITKCIRESIEKSWNNGSVDLIEKVFGYSIGYDNCCPSNALFVNTVVDYLKTCS